MRKMPPDATDVQVVDDETLLVTFEGGERRLFDLKPLLSRKCYADLNDIAFRHMVSVQNGCVVWPNDIDIDPEWLYKGSIVFQPTAS